MADSVGPYQGTHSVIADLSIHCFLGHTVQIFQVNIIASDKKLISSEKY